MNTMLLEVATLKKICFLFLHCSQILSANYVTQLQEKEGENMIKKQYNLD